MFKPYISVDSKTNYKYIPLGTVVHSTNNEEDTRPNLSICFDNASIETFSKLVSLMEVYARRLHFSVFYDAEDLSIDVKPCTLSIMRLLVEHIHEFGVGFTITYDS